MLCEYGMLLDVVDGGNSCTIISRTSGNAFALFIHPKTADGYKIGTYWMREHVYSEYIEPFAISVYLFKGSRDYYLTASGITTDDKITIKDSDDSDFRMLVKSIPNTNFKTVFCYAYVNNIQDDYCLVIGGRTVALKK